jgi:hypothetical protein
VGLLQRLGKIAEIVRATGTGLVLHLETHGSPQGLGSCAAEFIPWADLKAPLAAINMASRLNLLVLVQACNGDDLMAVVQPGDRAPFWGFIGPSRPVTVAEVNGSNEAFYRELFKSNDGGPAWQAMNASVTKGDSPFTCLRVEEMFRAVFRAYYREQCSEAMLAARLKRMIRAAKDAGLPPRDAELNQQLRDHRSYFNHAREQFFLHDIWPKNVSRFPISFEECADDLPPAV